MTPLPPLAWIGLGGALLGLGLWRNWSLCRALGVGGGIAGLAFWGLGETGPLHQLAMFAGLSLIAWIGGRRMERLADSLPDPHRTGLSLIGRAAIADLDFRHGHGTIRIGGETFDAVCRDDPKKGAKLRVTGRTDEALKVEIRG